MSRTSVPSRTASVRSLVRRRRKREERDKGLKPFGFCCSLDDFDPLTKYGLHSSPYRSSLLPTQAVNESPVLRFQTGTIEPGSECRKKISKIKFPNAGDQNPLGIGKELNGGSRVFQAPLQWCIEDEIQMGKDILWEQRQKMYNEEMDRNTIIGRKRMKIRMAQLTNIRCPRWYQDFSINQINNLMMLDQVLSKDYEEMVTGRTQRTLMGIGVISTFFKISPKDIRKLQMSCDYDAIEFLQEVYRILTGNYFQDEGHKKFYDCNERIILSAIAFLTLPETVIELHERLPPVTTPKLLQKPESPAISRRPKLSSPYEEELFTRPDWASHLNALQTWQEYCKLTPIPKIILPAEKYRLRSITFNNKRKQGRRFEQSENNHMERSKDDRSSKAESGIAKGEKTAEEKSARQTVEQKTQRIEKEIIDDIPRLPDETHKFDFTLSGLSEKPGPVEYKICGTIKPPQPNKKSWLGDKDAHYIISGATEEPPSCPVTYEMTGIANVTPSNSNERFFAVLKLGDGPGKIYPRGRKNLSRQWQEWLHNADEEFKKVEREANRMIKSIEATMRLVFPGPTCDSCCACRQTRKTHIKWHETKAPYLLIDSIAEDGDKNRYIVGSMAMHSPAPSPPESTVNLLEMVASEDKITTNMMINGVTNEKGQTQYFISGVKKDTVHVPSRPADPPQPKPLRNVPPCVCAVHQIFNKGLSPTTSKDNIPWTKDDGVCFGRKYRPAESAAYSCKTYPGDKSCRRNPFIREIEKLKRRKGREELKKDEYPPSDKPKYSIADFPPCGDEHGMAVCGGPWGAVQTLTKEELAEQERMRKEILKAPPCGTKPGRAVCEGPWGERIPLEQRSKIKIGTEEAIGEEDTVAEEEEEEEEEGEKEKASIVEVKEKPKRRDKQCYMSPETVSGRKKLVKKKEGKFIPDPNYHGYDDPWNIFRTAPTEKQSDVEFEKSLKLTTPQPRSAAVESKPERKKEAFDKTVERVRIKEVPRTEGRVKGTDGKTSGEDLKKKQRSTERNARPTTASLEIPKDRKRSKSVPDAMKESRGIKSERFESLTSKRRKRGSVSGGRSSVISTPLQKIGTGKILAGGNSGIKEGNKKRGNYKGPEPMKGLNNEKDIVVRTTVSGSNKSKNTTKDSKDTTSKRKKLNTLIHFDNKKEGKIGKANRNGNKRAKSFNPGKTLQPPQAQNKPGNTSESSNPEKIGKRDKKKDLSSNNETDPENQRRQIITKIKNMMMSPETYPYDVEPVVLPEEPRLPCTSEFLEKEDSQVSLGTDDKGTEDVLIKKGPCGWRTKSEQELPTKKTLIYLTEPDPPMETIPVRPGGKPCVCRENRNKKKILLYNIGGLLDKKKTEGKGMTKLFKKRKEEEDQKKTQVIDGVVYFTPPPSPRRSEEYVPEYDLYESPYDACRSQRKDENLKLLERNTGVKTSPLLETPKPCGCSEYTETHGMLDEADEEKKRVKLQLAKERKELMKGKSPKERWSVALKDPGLLDYFTQCRDNLPCWLQCDKFNKDGCSLRRKRLQTKRPVCECKYERKILERNEERAKWKDRQRKLKSLKKQPFKNIQDTSRPIEADTKLLISGVKRIPREDEYIDDIKYCITGVAQNYSMVPPQQVLQGVSMSTPFETPEPSKHDIKYVSMHRHWSPTNVAPGPLPRKNKELMEKEQRRREALEEAYRQIYEPVEVLDRKDHRHSCKEVCTPERSKGKRDMEEPGKEEKTPVSVLKKDVQPEGSQDRSKTGIRKERKDQENLQYKQSQELADSERGATLAERNLFKEEMKQEDSIEENRRVSESLEIDLMSSVKEELKRMAEEGFVFAKLPGCFLMPQLQDWLMYRQGFSLSEADKEKSVRDTIEFWNTSGVGKTCKVEVPSLKMTEREIRSLTFDDAEQIKRKIKEKKALFYSEIRKARVLYARSMWATMEHGKFPSRSFKKAFFTYMPGKEADGHIFRPWLPSEIREKSKTDRCRICPQK